VPGIVSIDLFGALPAGGLSGSLPLSIESPAATPGSSLLANPNGGSVALSWAASTGATSYRIKRCTSTSGPCVPAQIATSPSSSYQDGVRLDGNSYWYLVDALNSCGPTP
jgi:cellulose 1,4-beta-cellobiosidase